MSAVTTYARIRFKAFWRDPLAMFFTLAFPLLFLFVFGSIFGGSSTSFSIAFIDDAKTTFSKEFITQVGDTDTFSIESADSFDDAKQKMGRGEIDSIVELDSGFGDPKSVNGAMVPAGEMTVYYDQANPQAGQTVAAVMQGVLDSINKQTTGYSAPLVVTEKSTATAGLTQFDYTFSGMLSFTVLSLGIFGLANVLPAQKKYGVFRRISATPFRASQMITGTGLLYTALGIVSLALMMLAGLTVFHFHMRGNWLEFTAFLLLSLVTMIGFGLAIGGWAKNENQAAPLTNLIAFPMMFLSGTFFPRYLMPQWLQTVTVWLPLTPISDGIRYISTEGESLAQVAPQLGLVAAWCLVAYLVAFKVFRWE